MSSIAHDEHSQKIIIECVWVWGTKKRSTLIIVALHFTLDPHEVLDL